MPNGYFTESYVMGLFLAIKSRHDESDNCDCWRIFAISPPKTDETGTGTRTMTLMAEAYSRAEMIDTVDQMFEYAQNVIKRLRDMVDQVQMSRSVQEDISAL